MATLNCHDWRCDRQRYSWDFAFRDDPLGLGRTKNPCPGAQKRLGTHRMGRKPGLSTWRSLGSPERHPHPLCRRRLRPPLAHQRSSRNDPDSGGRRSPTANAPRFCQQMVGSGQALVPDATGPLCGRRSGCWDARRKSRPSSRGFHRCGQWSSRSFF